jgi:hypothetical protein
MTKPTNWAFSPAPFNSLAGLPMALISYRGHAPGNGAGRAQQAQRIAPSGAAPTSRLSKQGL